MSQHRLSSLLWFSSIAVTAIGQHYGWADSSELPQHSVIETLSPLSSNILIAAHRGGYQNDKEDGAPENSIANIQNCERHGYELFETDIQQTKDGRFVIVHDPTIDRETSGAGTVSDMTLVQLKAFQKKYRDGSLSSERVATLEEFLTHGKGHTVFKADLKPGVNQHFAQVMQLVAEHDAVDGIIFRVPYRDVELYHRFRESGGVISKHTLMFMVTSEKQVDDIKSRFDSSTIEIKLKQDNPVNEQALNLIRYATDKGFVVETHAYGDRDDWKTLIAAGVRIFHTSAPSKLQSLLKSQPAATIAK